MGSVEGPVDGSDELPEVGWRLGKCDGRILGQVLAMGSTGRNDNRWEGCCDGLAVKTSTSPGPPFTAFMDRLSNISGWMPGRTVGIQKPNPS